MVCKSTKSFNASTFFLFEIQDLWLEESDNVDILFVYRKVTGRLVKGEVSLTQAASDAGLSLSFRLAWPVTALA